MDDANFGLRDSAEKWAKMGWPVFPCDRKGKEPIPRHGCKEATTNLDKIWEWWRKFPDANVAIATGTPGPDVLDVDVKNGVDGFASLGMLRQAGLLSGTVAIVETPHKGLHLYFVGSSQGNGSLQRYGLDFRGSGGYVLAPPSYIRSTGHYRLADSRGSGDGGMIDWQACRTALLPRQINPRRYVDQEVAGGARGLVEWVRELENGNRNNGLYWAALRMAEQGVEEGDLAALIDAATDAGIDYGEAQQTVNSAIRRRE